MTPETASTTSTLRHRVVRGTAWTLPTSLGSRAVGLVGTLLLARYLSPSEYGVAVAASIAATTASSVTTFGVGIYLVSNAEISRAETFHASCWFLATGAVALMGTMWLGDRVGYWSGAPGLVKFLPVLILSTLLERITYVPERILVRHLRFGWLSLARTAGELTYTILTVLLAALGGGAMVIAWGSLARSAVRFTTIVPAVHMHEWLEPHRLRLATFRKIVAHGMNVTVASIATFGMRRWDNLLISRYFGAGAMGAYNYAYNLADTPATAIGDQVTDVIGASFPHIDARERAKVLVRVCTAVSLIMFPLSIGLAVVAPTVVETFFDTRWAHVGAMLACLSALSIARPLGSILASYLYTSRRPTTVLWIEWLSLIGIVAALSTVGRIGINWASTCVGVVFVLRALMAMYIVRRRDGVPLSEFLLPMTGPLAACMAMVVAVSAVRLAIEGLPAPVRLLIETASGAAVYIGSAWLGARSSCDELVRALRTAIGDGSRPSTGSAAATRRHPSVLSLSTEFPNPTEPAKGLFVRSRLQAMASRVCLSVVAPVASLDYANPGRDLFAAGRVPRARTEGHMKVLHPRWLYPPRGGWTNAFFLFARLLPLTGKLRARRAVDVIDAHFAHPEGIAAVLLGRILRCAVVVTIRGCELRYRHQTMKRFWMSWALRRADRVIAVSEGLRDLAIDLGVDPRRVRTVPNGVDADVFCRRDRRQCRSSQGIARADRIILSAGDLAELKGHHRVIAAVKDLSVRGLPARLLIAGGVGRSGRYAETLRQQVTASGLEDRVAFLGEVTQERLAQLMSAADVFCHASSTEGWPNVINEALACGTPVVATDVGAARQMVVADQYGYVVSVHDGAALADALHAALTSQWDHEAIAHWGRRRSWNDVAEDVLDEVRAVMAERARKHVELDETAADVTSRRGVRAVGSRFVG